MKSSQKEQLWNGGVYVPTVGELIEHLQEHYDHNEVVCYAIWTSDDVLEAANKEGIRVNRKEVAVILDRMQRGHNACFGINWDTIIAELHELRSLQN